MKFSQSILALSIATALSTIVSSAQAQASGTQSPAPSMRLSSDKTLEPSDIMRSNLIVSPSQVGRLEVTVAKNDLPADGTSSTQIGIELFDLNGRPLQGEATVTIETNAGRIQLKGASTDELGPGGRDVDRITSGVQLKVIDGRASFYLIAPNTPQDVSLKVSIGETLAKGQIRFVPQLREWIATGLIEGIISLRKESAGSAISPLRGNDGFEVALRQFSRSFNSNSANKGVFGARSAFFVRGTIKGEYLLSAAYDSDKDTRNRMLRDIRADQIYPVFGDASIRTNEAGSASKLYVRVDHGRTYALFGDFNTGDGFTAGLGEGQVASIAQRNLGAFNRSLTGLRFHFESPQLPPESDAAVKSRSGSGYSANVFAARDNLRQIVEELATNGTSGPFSIGRINAVPNTEKIELIIRDRNNPGRLLSQVPLQALVDYSLDPFSGRILMKGPIPSTDEYGNPQSLRITYEVSDNGNTFWVAGIDGQYRMSKQVELGGSLTVNQDPTPVLTPTERKNTRVASVNAGVMLTENSKLVVEVAQTQTEKLGATVQGAAIRVELKAQSANNQMIGSLSHVQTQKDFYNPSASLNEGRSETALKGRLNWTENLVLRAEVLQSKDELIGAKRDALTIAGDYLFNKDISVSLNVGKSRDNGSGLYGPIGSNAVSSLYAPGQTGLTPASGGLFGSGSGPVADPTLGQVPSVGTQTGAPLDTTTIGVGIKARVRSDVLLGFDAQASIAGDSSWRAAAHGAWQLSEQIKLHARYESQTGLGSTYDRAQKNNALVLGVSNRYLLQGLGAGNNGLQGEVFSEYRLRDAIGGRESQLASGLRNTFDIKEGWRAVLGLERLAVLNGTGQTANSVATGVDYIGSERWKGSVRLELRKTDENALASASSSLLNTLTVARKLDRDWTGLGRIYYTQTDVANTPGKQKQLRHQWGVAYRPVDQNRLDVLAMIEQKRESNTELASAENRRTEIASLQTNWHPARSFWLSNRLAYKRVDETLNVADSRVQDKFSAVMLSGRVIYDITERWDIGLMASVLHGQGAKQKAAGVEAGYAVRQNLWISAGYNFAGFNDRDLSGSQYTAKGAFIRLRFKFDEDLFKGNDKEVNRSADR